MVDPMRYPAADINSLYAHCREIELGYREQKQYMLEIKMPFILSARH